MSQKINPDRIITISICTVAILFGFIVKVMPSFFYWQGKNYLEQKNYIKAHSNLKTAYKLNKNSKDYRYYYVKSLLNLSPSLAVQKEIFEIAASDMEDSAQSIAQEQVNTWRSNLLQNIGANYIEQTPMDSGVMRWDINSFPLKYQILDESETTIPPYYETEILKAFSQWENSTQFIEFEQTDTPKDANILIKILPMPKDSCTKDSCSYVVGFTTPNYHKHLLKQMVIVLYVKDPFDNYFSDKEIYNTTLHELGHALGIMGHSYSSDDLMYMRQENQDSIYAKYRSSFQYLSTKDINTIKLLYKLYPTITNSKNIETKGLIYAPIVLGTSKEISNKKLKEAQNYIKKAPDLSSGYIDLGIAYAQLENYKEAIKAMHQAYEKSKNDTERYFSLYNISLLYFESDNLNKAEEYAIKAQEISQTEEVQELLMKIKTKKK